MLLSIACVLMYTETGEGWWSGITDTGASGWFPSSYLTAPENLEEILPFSGTTYILLFRPPGLQKILFKFVLTASFIQNIGMIISL